MASWWFFFGTQWVWIEYVVTWSHHWITFLLKNRTSAVGSSECTINININKLLRSHIPERYSWPFTNSFWRNVFLCAGFGKVWGTFPGYVGKIIVENLEEFFFGMTKVADIWKCTKSLGLPRNSRYYCSNFLVQPWPSGQDFNLRKLSSTSFSAKTMWSPNLFLLKMWW